MSKNSGNNFIDQTFTIIASTIVKILPASDREKQAFNYYRNGMSAQSEGEYSIALKNYYQSLRLETDPYDYIGLLHTNNGEHDRALEYYHQALERNPALPQALNNIAVIYHYRAEQMLEFNRPDLAELLFTKAEDYWKLAINLSPTSYLEVQGWLKMR
uniref:photosystem I assembly protein Ycf3 n=1 Tax=Trentepohlia sp. BN17 TaxID=3063876 RepID=UPI001EE0C1FF|nr:photosystem I assembly protein Ycf3 [Trentepohlia sp. BN17]UIB38733.1 photosystem I assembly protein Ycf3 [Trentepohlia sp. BN17]